MKVNEIFKSIQGEGLYSGAPAVFVRLAGCNLVCDWCDTKYALQGEFRKLCYKEVVSEVSMLAGPPMIVCFTGGEPMVDNSREFGKIIHYLKIRGYQIHVETNGTIPPDKRKIPFVDFWSVSPKLHCDFGKIYPPSKVSYLKSVKSICMLEAEKQLKFVIAKEEEVPLIVKLLIDMKLPDDIMGSIPIVIQPERFTFGSWMIEPTSTSSGTYEESVIGIDEFEELTGYVTTQTANGTWMSRAVPRILYLDNAKKLIPWCEKPLGGLNWRILPQLHYLLWSGKRGV